MKKKKHHHHGIDKVLISVLVIGKYLNVRTRSAKKWYRNIPIRNPEKLSHALCFLAIYEHNQTARLPVRFSFGTGNGSVGTGW